MTPSEAAQKALEKFPKAKKIAVENVAMWSSENTMYNALNLEQDARVYGWNADTQRACRAALLLQGKL